MKRWSSVVAAGCSSYLPQLDHPVIAPLLLLLLGEELLEDANVPGVLILLKTGVGLVVVEAVDAVLPCMYQ